MDKTKKSFVILVTALRREIDKLTLTLSHINQESYTTGSWDHQPSTLGDLKSNKVIDGYRSQVLNFTIALMSEYSLI